MVLVDGDYCTELELSCKQGKSWYAKWNGKICTEFDEPSKCTGKKVHELFCIDEYEFPNRKGERPRVMFNFPQAQDLCAAEGKRVCTETGVSENLCNWT
jgi:formylglycine-generating enzyme